MFNVSCLNCNLRFANSELAYLIFSSLKPYSLCLIFIKTEILCKYRNFFVTLHPKKEKTSEITQKS